MEASTTLRFWFLLAFFPHSFFAEDQHVLFLGNSYSFFNGGGPGIWDQYKHIAEACIPGFHVYYQQQSAAAWTLAMFAQDAEAKHKVADGVYDLLVIQDQSTLMELEGGLDAVKNWFGPQARKHGALLGLYETWASPSLGNNLTAWTVFLEAYYEKAAKLARAQGAEVVIARAGEAFHEVLKDKFNYDWQMPEFHKLYFSDYNHASFLGHNLAAWTMVLSFNRHRFTETGCDAHRVPNVANQNDDWKFMFAQIACELADVCPKKEVKWPEPPMTGLLLQLQGEWIRKKTLPEEVCQPGAHCTFLEIWRVNGTLVTQTTKEGRYDQDHVEMYTQELTHYLKVDGDTVKLMPEMSHVHQVKDGKVWFDDCMVLTRPEKKNTAQVDECWCMGDGTWKDYDSATCDTYATNIAHGAIPVNICKKEGGGIAAENACLACGKCHIPWLFELIMQKDAPEDRRLEFV